MKTFFGGFLFAAGTCILSGYLIARLIAIYGGKEHVYNTYEFSYSEEQMNNLGVSLGAYNNTFNFIFGLTSLPKDANGDPLFDIQNNPYVEFMGYEVDKEAGKHRMRDKHEFERCSEEIMGRFMKPHSFGWYDQPLCHKDRDNVQV